MISDTLKTAYLFHRRNRSKIGRVSMMNAVQALQYARADMAAGKSRHVEYPAYISRHEDDSPRSSERLAFVYKPEAFGLREVGRVMVDCGGRNGYWDNSGRCGYYADECGDNLCYGLVYQLPARDGKARFVAGYRFSEGDDGGAMVDFGTIFESASAFQGDSWSADVRDHEDAHDAARSADSMAEREAGKEREYQTAWRAGNVYAETKAEIADDKALIRKSLTSRRALKTQAARAGLSLESDVYAPLCDMIKSAVSNRLQNIEYCRDKIQRLADGDYYAGETYLQFYSGEKRLREAFNEGAGELVLIP